MTVAAVPEAGAEVAAAVNGRRGLPMAGAHDALPLPRRDRTRPGASVGSLAAGVWGGRGPVWPQIRAQG